MSLQSPKFAQGLKFAFKVWGKSGNASKLIMISPPERFDPALLEWKSNPLTTRLQSMFKNEAKKRISIDYAYLDDFFPLLQ